MSKWRVVLRFSLTGEQAESFHDYENDEGTEFYWTEGNFGCDCNRAAVMFPELAFEQSFPCNTGDNLIELILLEKAT